VFGLIWATLMFAVGMSAIVGGDMVAALSSTDPARAASLWTTVNLVMEGMGGGIELVGGLWMALISVAALRAGAFPRWLNRIGVVAGAAGVASHRPRGHRRRQRHLRAGQHRVVHLARRPHGPQGRHRDRGHPMITVTGVTKRYGQRTAVDDLTFEVAGGRVTGFVGPNGAGKSTTLGTMVGLTRPDRGEVRYAGVRYTDLATPARVVGSVLDARCMHPAGPHATMCGPPLR
jgi:ABC-type multidrug transport system fused ATPase/permease subunit